MCGRIGSRGGKWLVWNEFTWTEGTALVCVVSQSWHVGVDLTE